MPCIIHFIGVTSNEFCSSNLLSEFEAFSKDCAFEAGIINENSNDNLLLENFKNENIKMKTNFDYEPLQISTKNLSLINDTAKKLLERFFYNKNVILYISSTFFLEVYFN